MNARARTSASPDIVASAADWAALLDSDGATPEELAACEAWCREDPAHRRTLERMRGVDARFDGLAPVEQDALRIAAGRDGRGFRIGASLAGIAIVAAVSLLALQSYPVREQMADSRTGIGEQRSVTLGDGSKLVLDTATVADAAIGRDAREVTLFRGQLLAEVASDPARPFVVTTPEGSATALGTAFVVRREGESTLVTVTHSRVRVCGPGASGCAELNAGERARLSDGRVMLLAPVDPSHAASWSRGWLEADDLPLAEVLGELNRYRTHPIAFDPAAISSVRVTGSYPLADTDRALEAIAGTAGLKIVRSGPDQVRITR